MRRRLRILDVELDLVGPEAVIAPVAEAYRRFVSEAPRSGAGVDLRLEVAADLGSAEVSGKRVELVAGLEPTVQVYQLFLDQLMTGIGSHALLHAAALADGSGGVALIAAPSGHGKTSLALELASRGFGFLGDDYAPLELGNARLAPYPRAVGLRPDGRAPIPACFAEAARRPGPMLMGKRLLHVGDVLGEDRVVREALPLGHVLFLSADEHGAALPETRLVVAARGRHAAELDKIFDRTDGVVVLERERGPEVARWRLVLSPDTGATEALGRVLDSDRVLFAEKSWEAVPGFGGEPAAVAVPRREAAELLGRELLNRRSGGRLLAAHGGSVAALFVDLAGALREASCWRVRVGPLAATADLVSRLIRR